MKSNMLHDNRIKVTKEIKLNFPGILYGDQSGKSIDRLNWSIDLLDIDQSVLICMYEARGCGEWCISQSSIWWYDRMDTNNVGLVHFQLLVTWLKYNLGTWLIECKMATLSIIMSFSLILFIICSQNHNLSLFKPCSKVKHFKQPLFAAYPKAFTCYKWTVAWNNHEKSFILVCFVTGKCHTYHSKILSHGYHMDASWISHESQMYNTGIMWISHWHIKCMHIKISPLTFPWQSHGSNMSPWWVSHGHHMNITWASYGYHMSSLLVYIASC